MTGTIPCILSLNHLKQRYLNKPVIKTKISRQNNEAYLHKQDEVRTCGGLFWIGFICEKYIDDMCLIMIFYAIDHSERRKFIHFYLKSNIVCIIIMYITNYAYMIPKRRKWPFGILCVYIVMYDDYPYKAAIQIQLNQ